MERIAHLVAILAIIGVTYGQKKQNVTDRPERFSLLINNGWTFNYFSSETADKGYESPGFNDSKWPVVGVPHTWNSFESSGEIRPFAKSPGENEETSRWTGWGWYRKHFTLKSLKENQKIFLEFEGVQKYCKIWINGKIAGEHLGGYGSFDFDITDLVKPGYDNIIAVAVSYLQKAEFKVHPTSEGDATVSCGIYRNVRLVMKNRLFIPMHGSALHEGGTFVTTRTASDHGGLLTAVTWVKNDYSEPKNCVLQTTLFDNKMIVVQVIRSETMIKPGTTFQFIQTGKPLMKAHLWSPDDPYLYTVLVEVLEKKELCDSYSIKAGFRSIITRKTDTSAVINGNILKMKPGSWHPEYPWLGDAIPEWLTDTFMQQLAIRGKYNMLCSSGYPFGEHVFDLADSLGILLTEDFEGVTTHGFTTDEQRQQVLEIVRRDRNHPSLLSWRLSADSTVSGSIFPFTEDSLLRCYSPFTVIKPENLNFTDPMPVINTDSLPAGNPAKIVLSASSHSVIAGKGSVVLIRALVTDANGRPVTGARNNVKWITNGPGKLAGPSYYSSYADSSKKQNGFYIEMPAFNLIRSTGTAGKIIVSVFAAGLASSSLEIESVPGLSDNSQIAEIQLSDEGRHAISSNQLVTQRLEEVPNEIKNISEDFSTDNKSIKWYSDYIKNFVRKNNPLVDTTSVESSALAGILALQLHNNGGRLAAADFNYNAEHYNTVRLISAYISRTKLPYLFRESLKRYYSRMVITHGFEKNAGDEMDWLNWIPSGGQVAIVPDEKTPKDLKGVIYCKDIDLQSIIKSIYPKFEFFSLEGKERALLFIAKMNPSVHVKNNSSPAKQEIMQLAFYAEKGEPILIPEFKFISE